ncbi:MAG: membrane lipoprotein lipid attachment site-containing protein [Muribaculaceae bacterium]|nr:membrane lipoprotein lipid attachment site-containing protein [Muribaculaceae bacterium]
MKKSLFFAAIALMLSSCSQTMTTVTSTSLDTKSQLLTATTADLEVQETRISYTMVPSEAIRLGGKENVINAAVHEALQKNGNADVLVDLEHVIEYRDGKIISVTVSGHPAKYKNYHSLGDTYWLK